MYRGQCRLNEHGKFTLVAVFIQIVAIEAIFR